jgi:hypothetical protein
MKHTLGLLALALCLFVGCGTPEAPIEGSLSGVASKSNTIYYTSANNVVVTPAIGADFGVTITENTNTNGVGSITFSGNVTTIPEGAFERCIALKSILLPSSLVTIGDRAFMNCANLTEIVIPDSVTTIGESAFTGCSSLQSVTFGKGLLSIGNNAFTACSSLTSLDLPDSLEEIGKGAIPANTAYTLPSDFTITYRTTDSQIIPISESSSWAESLGTDYIISHTFDNGVGKITFNKRLTQVGFNYVENNHSYGDTLLEVTLPESITTIRSSAFMHCWDLQKINFPAGLTEIGHYAFGNCQSLTEVVIPRGVKTIEGYAFIGCSALKSLTIENGVEVIEEHAFEGCSELGEVIIPESVTMIEEYAFSNNVQANLVLPEKFYIHYNAPEQIFVPYSYDYTGSATYLIRHNFADGKGSACFNAPLAAIGRNFFSGRTTLTGVTIPESVTMIGERAFYNCTAIQEIVIPEGVEKIIDRAFENCSSLSKVTLLSTVPPTISTPYSNYHLFDNTASNLKIYVPAESIEAYRTAAGWSTYIDRITAY